MYWMEKQGNTKRTYRKRRRRRIYPYMISHVPSQRFKDIFNLKDSNILGTTCKLS